MNKEEIQEQTAKKSSLLHKIIKTVLPLALGVAIIYFLFQDINVSEMWGILQDVNWGILLFSLIFGWLGHTIRGYRWQLFLKPLGYQTQVWHLNYAIYGAYAINIALPRAGEIWRCGVLVKDQNVPFSRLFGTMILDRIFDTITVLLISLVAFLLNMQFFLTQLEQNQDVLASITGIFTSPYLYLSILLVIIFIYIIFRFFRSNIVVMKISEFISGIVQDIKAIWKMDEKVKLFLYTVGIWASYFCFFYTTFFAFDFTRDLGFTAGLIAFAAGSISMGVPSNGGLGPWHIAVVAALGLYGIDKLQAMAFATCVFTLQSLIWTSLLGLFGIVMLSLSKKKRAK